MNAIETATEFETGRTYFCRSIGDHECVWEYTIARRTAKTIYTTCGKALRINKTLTAMDGVESVMPLGRYSMAPILSADKLR